MTYSAGLERVTNNNQNDDPRDDTDYFMLPENVNAEQARQAALMTYIFNAGTGYGSSRGNINNDFAETSYSAAEVQRIKDRQAANRLELRIYSSMRLVGLPPHRTAC